MSEKTIYNMSDEKDRRELFGIDEEAMEGQSFLLHNREEVEGFSGLLADYVQEEFGTEFHWIDLPAWYDKCQNLSNGGRLFSAVLDLKITLAFLLIDSRKSALDFNSLNRKDAMDILSEPQLFKKKMKELHESIDLAIRYRSFFDKFMGILVLIFCKEKEYESFVDADSRKKLFKKLMSDKIDPSDMEDLMNLLTRLDNNYRTAEIHQAGRMRKWVLSSQDLYLDKVLDFMGYTNAMIEYSRWLDKLREELPLDQDV